MGSPSKTIYTGPAVKSLGLRAHHIFIGELPAHVQAAIDNSPAFADKFISFDQFSKNRPPGAPAVNANSLKAPVKVGPPIAKYL